MPLPLLGIAAGGALLKGLGSFFGGRSKQKKEDAAAKETHRANKAGFDQGEQSRQQALRSLLGSMQGRGINLNTDPGAFETRQYTGGDPSKVTQAGRGSALAGALLGGVGDLGLGAAQSMQQRDILSAGQPVGDDGVIGGDMIAQMAQEAGVSEDDIRQLIAEQLADRQNG
jgi:hypothetical protein